MPVEIINKEIIRAIELAYDVQNPQGEISEEKKVIKKIFNQTQDFDDKEILRLAVINGIYSTRASVSVMISLSETIQKIEKDDLKLKDLFMKYLKKEQQERTIRELFDGKYGDKENHACSLISKYAYFLTDFEFPIYDSFVTATLRTSHEKNYIGGNEVKSIIKSYFKHYYCQYIHELSLHVNGNAVDKIDAFGWVTEKLRLGQEFEGWCPQRLPELKEVLKKLELTD